MKLSVANCTAMNPSLSEITFGIYLAEIGQKNTQGTMLGNFRVEPRKTTFICWGVVRMSTPSFGLSPSENPSSFPADEPTKLHKKWRHL